MTAIPAGGRAATVPRARTAPAPPPGLRGRGWIAAMFLAPALLLLGALVVYPTIDTVAQSFQSDTTRQWVGLANYREVLSSGRVLTALRNNAIWVAVAPAVITGLGLVFAILTERVRYATAVKVVVFMPMAISFLATGVIWRIMYDSSPERGVLNATAAAVYDVFTDSGQYVGAKPGLQQPVDVRGGGVTTRAAVNEGGVVTLGLTAFAEGQIPGEPREAALPAPAADAVTVLVWRDFRPGGGEPGVVDAGERAMPEAKVQLLDARGREVASGETDESGVVRLRPEGNGPFRVRLAASNFQRGFAGIDWLGPSLVTPAIIGAFCWMWAGFAVVVIGAGLAALPREVLEAARVDGANEWQVFRRVTLPLLGPVLGVVFVTMVINVLKIFDIVLVTAPGATQDEANVIALDMWKTSFTARQYGAGSAIAVLLFLLVVPVMVLNVRRIGRQEQ